MAQVEAKPSGAGEAYELDYAAQSFWVSQDAELDWLDRNAVIDRKDSGKAAHNPPSTGSNRFSGSVKTKPSIIGLPKPSKPNYRKPCNKGSSIRLFPKRTNSVGNKSEPSSPKVSCMGRVRSRRSRKVIHDTKPGFWNNFRAMFRPKSQNTDFDSGVVDASVKKTKTKKTMKKKKSKKRELETNACGSSEAEAEAPGLGSVKRFASARRSDAWAADLEINVSTDKGPTPYELRFFSCASAIDRVTKRRHAYKDGCRMQIMQLTEI